jgi:hypothetical protein
VSPRPSHIILAAALLGSVALGPSHAASAAAGAAAPAAHVKECAGQGMKDAATMTLVSTVAGRHVSGPHRSVANAWLYAVPGTDRRCVVAEAKGARLGRKARTDTAYSAGYEAGRSGVMVVDTGETLPLASVMVHTGGATGRTSSLADVSNLVQTERVPDEAAGELPPELAGLAGHEVTLTTTELEVRFYLTAVTSTRLARPMTPAQARKKQAAEVAAAREVLEARLAAASAERDSTLAQATISTGLTAAWLRFSAAQQHEWASASAKAAFSTSKGLAREHARQARQGVDVRQAYAHEITLAVPLQ